MSLRTIARGRLLYHSEVEYANYALNHYSGCAMGCTYCSAMLNGIRRKQFRDRSDWMNPRIVKDAIAQLSRELSRAPKDLRQVWLCPVTDCYQPIEDTVRLTRGLLEVLIAQKVPTWILTKSIGILRDAELIIENRGLVSVGFTITTLDENIRRVQEPNASPVWDRARALAYFHKNGVETKCSVEPILDEHPLAIVDTLKGDVDYWYFGKDNYTKRALPYKQIRDGIIAWVRKHTMKNYLIKRELLNA